MKVEYVKASNFEFLLAAYDTGIRNGTKDFGKNIRNLLSHISVSFVISDISILEAFMIKRFSGAEIIDHETTMVDDNVNAIKFTEAMPQVKSLFLLNDNMTEDNDLQVKPGPLFLPLKSIQKKITVTFNGMSVLNIIGEISRSPLCFCNDVLNRITENPDTSDTEILNNALIENFIKEFYSFMSYSYKYIDVLSDSLLDGEYLSNAKPVEMCVLSHVNTLFGMIPFTDVDETRLSTSLLSCQENKKTYKESTGIEVGDDLLKCTTDLYFICASSLYSFIETYLYLPIGTILEYTDIKILFTSNTYIIPDVMNKYQTRLTNIFSRYYTWMKNFEAAQGDELDMYNMILGNIEIRYVIKLSLSDITSIIIDWENSIKNGLYGDEKNYINKELLKIIAKIKQYAVAVFNTVKK